ncbi:hypothetical protein RJ639_024656 [Escallonia herrerae]|uniref:BHLH domain-containing protein n=1 Tax=Escallonia herrerae TaxID=1293975 RepID=A0AA89AD84_9ASTE|nr:hypothetical protein RJ639_024656 [Escallonia herrerae]
MFPSLGKPGDCSCVVLPAGGYPSNTDEVIKEHEGPQYPMSGYNESADLLHSDSEMFHMQWQKKVQMKWDIDRRGDGETSGFRDPGVDSKDNDSFFRNNLKSSNPEVDDCFFGNNNQNGILCVPKHSNMQNLEDLEKQLPLGIEFNIDSMTSFRFSAGCELYDALGPSFRKDDISCDWKAGKTGTGIDIKMPAEVLGSGNLLMNNSSSEHLLEAVVANACHSNSDVKAATSYCKSVESSVTTGNMLELPSSGIHTIGSFSIDQSSHIEEDVSGSCGSRSFKGFSSASPSRCNEPLEKTQDPAKLNKKRARPGENCRPRPRDRQLIQDRIKELRELVPSGSKCSIDSLLERTIKHMLYMQCITKHADKLDKFAESKLLGKGTGVTRSSNYEQGSSWAMEVGSELKVCPIVVENLNMNGQMLVEMLCENCSSFLQIAEAIRSLGLTILKGVTEAYGEKTWICFVVELQAMESLQFAAFET